MNNSQKIDKITYNDATKKIFFNHFTKTKITNKKGSYKSKKFRILKLDIHKWIKQLNKIQSDRGITKIEMIAIVESAIESAL